MASNNNIPSQNDQEKYRDKFRSFFLEKGFEPDLSEEWADLLTLHTTNMVTLYPGAMFHEPATADEKAKWNWSTNPYKVAFDSLYRFINGDYRVLQRYWGPTPTYQTLYYGIENHNAEAISYATSYLIQEDNSIEIWPVDSQKGKRSDLMEIWDLIQRISHDESIVGNESADRIIGEKVTGIAYRFLRRLTEELLPSLGKYPIYKALMRVPSLAICLVSIIANELNSWAKGYDSIPGRLFGDYKSVYYKLPLLFRFSLLGIMSTARIIEGLGDILLGIGTWALYRDPSIMKGGYNDLQEGVLGYFYGMSEMLVLNNKTSITKKINNQPKPYIVNRKIDSTLIPKASGDSTNKDFEKEIKNQITKKINNQPSSPPQIKNSSTQKHPSINTGDLHEITGPETANNKETNQKQDQTSIKIKSLPIDLDSYIANTDKQNQTFGDNSGFLRILGSFGVNTYEDPFEQQSLYPQPINTEVFIYPLGQTEVFIHPLEQVGPANSQPKTEENLSNPGAMEGNSQGPNRDKRMGMVFYDEFNHVVAGVACNLNNPEQ